MANVGLTISTPAATIVDAASRIYEATLNYAAAVRTSESQEARDMEDRIRFQAYWDFRAVLQFIGVVGDVKPWPPPEKPAPVNIQVDVPRPKPAEIAK